MRQNFHFQSPARRILLFAFIVLVLGGGVLLDLNQQGALWRFFWSQTGEEEPIAQIRGMVEWVGNITRPQPNLALFAPVNHAHVNPYGINTFLQKEVEIPKMRVQLQMIADAGFRWLRQEFPWEDLEVDGRGQFTDSRNDYDGDGVKDTIDAWEKYDRIVDLVEEYGLALQVRLSNPPDWAVTNVEQVGSFAPPDDFDDFVNFAVAVAARYKGRIHYYQIWNEPNGNEEWGRGRGVDPEGYTDLLCRTYRALKAVDDEIVVISAALTPTVSLSGDNLNEFIYLQRMYDAGAGACFDIMAAQGYGLYSGPTDRRMRPTTVSYVRPLYIRDIMVANGDAHKAIWISEAAWNPVDEPDVPRDIVGYANYGVTSKAQAARYMVEAYQRAQQEWPFIGVINYWFFTRPDDSETGQAFFYFRMVEPDYQPDRPTFTPLPVYTAMQTYIASQNPVLYHGVHQAEDWRVSLPDDAQIVPAPGAQFGKAVQTSSARFTIYGTHLALKAERGLPLSLYIDEAEYSVNTTPIYLSLLPREYHVRLAAPVLLDAIIVMDRTVQHLVPLLGVAGVLLGMIIWVLVRARRGGL